MYYPINYSSTPAMMPRILSEDVGIPELRTPMLPSRRKFRLWMPKWSATKREPQCTCKKTCTA